MVAAMATHKHTWPNMLSSCFNRALGSSAISCSLNASVDKGLALFIKSHSACEGVFGFKYWIVTDPPPPPNTLIPTLARSCESRHPGSLSFSTHLRNATAVLVSGIQERSGSYGNKEHMLTPHTCTHRIYITNTKYNNTQFHFTITGVTVFSSF